MVPLRERPKAFSPRCGALWTTATVLGRRRCGATRHPSVLRPTCMLPLRPASHPHAPSCTIGARSHCVNDGCASSSAVRTTFESVCLFVRICGCCLPAFLGGVKGMVARLGETTNDRMHRCTVRSGDICACLGVATSFRSSVSLLNWRPSLSARLGAASKAEATRSRRAKSRPLQGTQSRKCERVRGRIALVIHARR